MRGDRCLAGEGGLAYFQMVGPDDRMTIRADGHGLISHWGAGLEALLGHTPEQAIGKSIGLIIPTPLHAWHWRGFDRALRTGASRRPGATAKVPAVHRDGTIVAVKGEIGLTKGGDGTVDGAEVANVRSDAAWKSAAWKPLVALVGLAGRAGLRPRSTNPNAGSGD